MRTFRNARLVIAAGALAGFGVLSALNAQAPAKPADRPKEVAASDGPADRVFAVEPKPLSEAVRKGLAYLVKEQKEDGGWSQGGGWRTNLEQGGRVEGEDVADPPDVGNTCIALLALIRAGNTPDEGPYAKNVRKGIEFVMAKVEQADKESLAVTDVKGTQLQSKIGPYIDTFLSAMVFAEVKGKSKDGKFEQRLLAAAEKTLGKMAKHQKEDGTFAGNDGWASVLSQGVANKAFNYAAQNALPVSQESLRRIEGQVAANFDAKSGTFKPTGGGAGLGGGLGGAPGASAPSDAGVPLYKDSTGLTNAADVLRSYRQKGQRAREVLDSETASKEERDEAKKDLEDVARLEKLNEAQTEAAIKQINQPGFVEGFGSNGGEEFLSFMNISETLLLKGGDEWKEWDQRMTRSIDRAQNGDGSWSGQHCITGKTFCTAAALLVLMADRTQFPADTLEEARTPKVEKPKK